MTLCGTRPIYAALAEPYSIICQLCTLAVLLSCQRWHSIKGWELRFLWTWKSGSPRHFPARQPRCRGLRNPVLHFLSTHWLYVLCHLLSIS